MNLTIPPGTRDKVSQPEPASDGTACIKLLDIISRPPPLDLAFRLANPPRTGWCQSVATPLPLGLLPQKYDGLCRCNGYLLSPY